MGMSLNAMRVAIVLACIQLRLSTSTSIPATQSQSENHDLRMEVNRLRLMVESLATQISQNGNSNAINTNTNVINTNTNATKPTHDSILVTRDNDDTVNTMTGPLPELSVVDFGAKGDGSDDTAAFQAALDAAQKKGNAIVNVPAGTYTIRGHLSIPQSCELRGANHFPYRTWGTDAATVRGTTLLAYEGAGNVNATTATPFIMMSGPNVGLSGMSIVYPEQANATSPTPIPYPWCIRGVGDNVAIKNMFLVNPYLGIDLGTQPAGRHLVSDVHGNPLKIGIFVDQCFDVGRIRHIHFWNFWAGTGPSVVGPLQRWISDNGVTLLLARTDWEVVQDVFSWGYSRGVKLITSNITDPKTNESIGAMNGQFTDIQFDAVDVGVEVFATDPYGAFFSNLNLANAGWGSTSVGISCVGGCDGNVIVSGASFWGAFHQAVRWNGLAFFSISDSTVETWNNKFAAMEFSGGRVSVRGCTFGIEPTQQLPAVALSCDATVDRLIVLGNDLMGSTINSTVKQSKALVTNNLA